MSSAVGINGSPHAPRTPAADVNFTSIDAGSHGDTRRGSTGRNSKSSSVVADRKNLKQDLPESPPVGDALHHGLGTLARRAKKSGGFLLESTIVQTRSKPTGKSRSEENSVESDQSTPKNSPVNRRLSAQRFSGESSTRGSPLSRELSRETSPEPRMLPTKAVPSGSAIDPAQLVQMALSLSESRKRGVSNTLHVPGSPHRTHPGPTSDMAYGTVRSHRTSRPLGRKDHSSPETCRPAMRDMGGRGAMDVDDKVLYTFSPATLSRAEKARKYFELASEHRRLLEHLPPLRPDMSPHNGHSLQSSMASPGKTLGRTYNPLQALRNRRLRNRERRPLTASPDSWQETDRIKRWIDDVAAGSRDPGYCNGEDNVRLPFFEGETDTQSVPLVTAKGHTRTATVQSVISRPENGWVIEPAELLADTYWVEKSDHKGLIEDRHGRLIFPSRKHNRAGSQARSHTEQRAGVKQHRNGNDSDEERPHNRRKPILHIPDRLRRPHLSRALSTASGSSLEGTASHVRGVDMLGGVGDANIGPLERHMRDLIAKDERGELSSPEPHSPDHWDSKRTPHALMRDLPGRESRDFAMSQDPFPNNLSPHKRVSSRDHSFQSPDYAMSSMDDMLSHSPTSPSLPSFTFPTDRNTSPHSSLQFSNDSFSPDSGVPAMARRRGGDRGSVADTAFGSPLSPVISADGIAPIVSRHGLEGKVMPKQQGTSLEGAENGSLAQSVDSKPNVATNEGLEKGTANNRRLFKGRRIGEMVRTESSRLGGKIRGKGDRATEIATLMPENSQNLSEQSELEDDSPRDRKGSKGDTTDLDSEISPRTSLDSSRPKGRHYLPNLPSFRSPNARDRRGVATPPSGDSGAIAGRPRAHLVRGHSFGFRQSALPLLRGADADRKSSPERSAGEPGNAPRLQSAIGQPSTERRSASPQEPTGLSAILPRARRLAIGDLPESKRHWSISDNLAKVGPADIHVNARDIARVRALLLASGIKAHEILEIANSVRGLSSPTLSKVAAFASKKDRASLDNVRRIQEPLVAARLLSLATNREIESLEASIFGFRTRTVTSLTSRIMEVRTRANDQLATLVRETGDDADAFTVELTTKQPQDIQRVDDAIDAMYRQRRRQFRWIRRAGFKALEWMLLSIMWWVWFIVMLVNTTRKIILGLAKGVKWLIWF